MASKITQNRTAQVVGMIVDATERGAERVANRSLELAKGYSAVRTGANRDSGKTEQTGPAQYEGSFNMPYSLALEVGTSRMAAQPYVIVSLEQIRAGEGTEIFKDEFGKVK